MGRSMSLQPSVKASDKPPMLKEGATQTLCNRFANFGGETVTSGGALADISFATAKPLLQKQCCRLKFGSPIFARGLYACKALVATMLRPGLSRTFLHGCHHDGQTFFGGLGPKLRC